MRISNWTMVKHFHKGEAWGDPDKMQLGLMLELDRFREWLGRTIVIHSGYRTDSHNHITGYHADLHIEGLSAVEQFIAAVRFGFTAIGVNPYWNNPGLHLGADPDDVPKRIWGYTENQEICELTPQYLAMIA